MQVAHRGDRPLCDRASCRGWDADHRDGDHQLRLEPGGHLGDGACPGSARTGCFPAGQWAAVCRGSHGARGSRGHLEACPGWVRTGCCPVEALPGEAPGERRQQRLRAPRAHPESAPQALLECARRVPPGCLRTGSRRRDEQETRGPGLGRIHERGPRARSPKPQRGRQVQPRRQQVPKQLRWPSTSCRQVSSRRPCHPRRSRRGWSAGRGTSRESCGRQAARWSKTPTGRTRRFPSDG